MKKLALFATLAIAATASFAQVTGFVNYDYDRVDSGKWISGHRVVTGAKLGLGGNYGSVDGGVTANRLYTSVVETTYGAEVGYSNAIRLGIVDVTGRVGYQYAPKVRGWRTSVEASVPLNEQVSAFAGYEHLDIEFKGTGYTGNRYTLGLNLPVTPGVNIRVGLSQLQAGGRSFNGATTAVTYAF